MVMLTDELLLDSQAACIPGCILKGCTISQQAVDDKLARAHMSANQ